MVMASRGWLLIVCALASCAEEPDSEDYETSPDDPSAPQFESDAGVGPIVGAVTDDSARIWARSGTAASYSLHFGAAEADDDLAPHSDVRELGADTDFTGVLDLTGLQPATRYEYEVRFDDAPAARAIFTTLPSVDTPTIFRFAFAADIHRDYKPYALLAELLQRGPQLLVLAGDLMYADLPVVVTNDVDAYWQRYRETWSDADFAALTSQVPTLMMWDDHEIINDWYPGLDDRYEAARNAYDTYQGSHNPASPDTGEIYYSASAPGVDLFVLDVRSHRSPNADPDSADKTMLGARQRATLLAWLGASTAAFKIIVSAVPFNRQASTGYDSWNGYPSARASLLGDIEAMDATGVLLLSGDQHWSGIYPIETAGGFRFYEFMPSPVAVVLREPAALPEGAPEPLAMDVGNYAYGLFDIDTRDPDAPRLSFELAIEGERSACLLNLTPDDLGSAAAGQPLLTCEGGALPRRHPVR